MNAAIKKFLDFVLSDSVAGQVNWKEFAMLVTMAVLVFASGGKAAEFLEAISNVLHIDVTQDSLAKGFYTVLLFWSGYAQMKARGAAR
jgi:hypothetical protein